MTEAGGIEALWGPEPDRDGQQLVDRRGRVWTWTPHWRLEHPDSSARPWHLVREADDGTVVAESWAYVCTGDGPLRSLPDVPPGYVVLRCEAVVNGRRGHAQEAVLEQSWELYGAEFQAALRARMQHRLAEALVKELDPPVSVQRAPLWVRQAEAGMLGRFPPSEPGAGSAE